MKLTRGNMLLVHHGVITPAEAFERQRTGTDTEPLAATYEQALAKLLACGDPVMVALAEGKARLTIRARGCEKKRRRRDMVSLASRLYSDKTEAHAP